MVRFEVGDLVDESEPFAHVLNEELKGERCDYCFQLSNSLSRCSNCRWMWYCDRKCQHTDWKSGHKWECKEYKLDATREPKLFIKGSFSRLLLRTLFIKLNCPERVKRTFKIYNGSNRCFDDLMDHVEEIRTSEKPNRWNLAKKIYSKITTSLEVNLDIDEKTFLSTFGKIIINSFSILNVSLNEIGSGLYVSTSVFDHNCQPNCSPIFNRTKLSIRCIRPFDSSLEPATITYIDLKLPREERQLRLRDQYYFNCTCNRCCCCSSSSSSSHSSPSLSSSTQNGASDNNREDCGEGVVDDEEEEDEDTIGRNLIKLNEQFDDEIESGNWCKAFFLGLETLPLYQRIYKTYYADFTVQLMRVAKIRANIVNGPDDEDEMIFLINKVHEAILITHGKDHPLYSEEFTQLTGPA